MPRFKQSKPLRHLAPVYERFNCGDCGRLLPADGSGCDDDDCPGLDPSEYFSEPRLREATRRLTQEQAQSSRPGEFTCAFCGRACSPAYVGLRVGGGDRSLFFCDLIHHFAFSRLVFRRYDQLTAAAPAAAAAAEVGAEEATPSAPTLLSLLEPLTPPTTTSADPTPRA